MAVQFTHWPWYPSVCVIIHSLCSSLHLLHESRAYQYSSRIRGRRFIVLFPMREKDAVPSSLPPHQKPIPHPAVFYGCTHSLSVSLSLIVASYRRRSRLDTLLQLSGVWHPSVVSQNREGVSCTFNLTDSSHPIVCTTAGHCVLEQRQGEGSGWEMKVAMTNQAKVEGQAPTGATDVRLPLPRLFYNKLHSGTVQACTYILYWCKRK